MRNLSHRYADLPIEVYSDVDGIDQTLGLKALAGGNRGGACTDYADSISFRKHNIATDGFCFGRMGFDGTGILSGLGRGLGMFQFYDTPLDFCTVFGSQYATASNNPPMANKSIDSHSVSAIEPTNVASESNVGLSQLTSHATLNGYDIIADLEEFSRIAGSSRNYAPVIQQPQTPSVSGLTAINYSSAGNWGSSGSGESQFSNPSGIAVDSSGNVYVLDAGNNRVQKFSSSGSWIATYTDGHLHASNASSIYLDSSGNIYIGVNGNPGQIYEFNSSFVYQSTFSGYPSGVGTPTAIMQDSSNNFWVVDESAAKIYEFNSSQVYQSTLSPSGAGFTPFVSPFGLVIDSSNNFYVSDSGTNLVQQLNSSGDYQWNYPIPGAQGMSTDGTNIFVVGFQVVSLGHSGRFVQNTIYILSSSGSLLSSFAGQNSSTGTVINTLVYSSETIFYSSSINDEIFYFTIENLDAFYAYCYTLVDANLNESQPSPLAAIQLSDQQTQLTINLDGLQATANNWTTIRIYRTLGSLTAITASQNPTFYYVPGLDIAISSGTAIYTTMDGVPDSTLYNDNNFQLTNTPYEDGALTALAPGWVPAFITSWLGYVIAGNWVDPNGNSYPRRVMWSAQTDNSGVSSGNVTTWANFNYTDVGDSSTGDILGVFPGLQGRAYIWCQNATFLMLATGNSEEPFEFIQISNQYGFYHHTVTEVPGGVMGRTKDGIAIFNGAFFNHVSHQILRTLGTCLSPEADSAAFDFDLQRFYIAVCDTTLTQASSLFLYGTGTDANTSYGSILQAYRNTVLVYDMPTKRWEIYRRVPIQYFCKLKDSFGKEAVYGVGMSSDIYYITANGYMSGFSISEIVPVSSTNNGGFGYGLQFPVNLSENLTGKSIYLPLMISGDDSSFSNILFSTTISSVGIPVLDNEGQQVYDNEGNPVYSNTNLIFLEDEIPDIRASYFILIDNANGTVGTGSNTSTIVDPENYFLAPCVNGMTASIYNPTTLNEDSSIVTTPSNYLTEETNTELAVQGSAFSQMVLGDQYVLNPSRWVQAQSSWDPLYQYLTPPYGYKIQERRKKAFLYMFLKIMGSGPLRFDFFVDQIWTPKNGAIPNQTIIQNIDLPAMSELRLNLNGAALVGYVLRVLITGIKGWTYFEIDDHTIMASEMAAYSAQ